MIKKCCKMEVSFMCTRRELDDILTRIVKIYYDVYGEHIVKVILYGSYSRGDFREDSDVDIVAIVDGDRENLQGKLKRVWNVSSNLELEYDTIISPTVIPYKEFMQYKNVLPYYKNIANEGVVISAGK